jgi:hypothetical protein
VALAVVARFTRRADLVFVEHAEEVQFRSRSEPEAAEALGAGGIAGLGANKAVEGLDAITGVAFVTPFAGTAESARAGVWVDRVGLGHQRVWDHGVQREGVRAVRLGVGA